MTQSSETPHDQEENEASWINTQLLQDALGHDVKILDFKVKPATAKGENMMGILNRTRVEYNVGESNEVLIKELIVKTIPEGEFLQGFARDCDIFGRETSVYDALQKMYAFVDSRLKGREFRRFSTQSYPSSRPETLIIDDLKPSGFVLASRKDRFDLTHAKIVIQTLARFHALSLTYSQENPNFLDSFPDVQFARKNFKRMSQFFEPVLKSISREMKRWEGFSEIANKIENMVGDFVDRLADILKSDESFINVLIHGDCWINNLMFKYSDSGQPIDLKFIDFQGTRKGSPAVDLIYFLMGSLQNNTRINHWDDLLCEYCDAFKRIAQEIGYNGPTITYEDLCEEIKRIGLYSFTCILTTTAVVLANPEDTPELSTMTEEQIERGEVDEWVKMYSNPEFKEIFQDLLPYFKELGVFD